MKYKKILYLLLLMLWLIGAVGGVCYTAYYGGYVITVGLLVVAWMSWPKFKECFTQLTL